MDLEVREDMLLGNLQSLYKFTDYNSPVRVNKNTTNKYVNVTRGEIHYYLRYK